MSSRRRGRSAGDAGWKVAGMGDSCSCLFTLAGLREREKGGNTAKWGGGVGGLIYDFCAGSIYDARLSGIVSCDYFSIGEFDVKLICSAHNAVQSCVANWRWIVVF